MPVRIPKGLLTYSHPYVRQRYLKLQSHGEGAIHRDSQSIKSITGIQDPHLLSPFGQILFRTLPGHAAKACIDPRVRICPLLLLGGARASYDCTSDLAIVPDRWVGGLLAGGQSCCKGVD